MAAPRAALDDDAAGARASAGPVGRQRGSDGARGHVQRDDRLERAVDGQAHGPRRVAEAVARPAARVS